MKKASWRTTTLGVLAMVGTVVSVASSLLSGHTPDLATLAAAWASLMAGWGLVHGADSAALPPAK